MRNLTETTVITRPPCDLCGAPAFFDAKSYQGPWGFFCQECFDRETPGRLGEGVGQRLIVKDDRP